MASSTTNLDLTLPVGGEHVSRQIINANNVKIDEAVGAVPSGTDLQSQVTALNSNITNLSDSIGTVPSGETVEGQITALNNNVARKILTGNATYNDLHQGGYSGRTTVNITFASEMPHDNYYASAELNNAYADFTDITCYIFNKTTTGMTVTLVDKASGSSIVEGAFRWVAIAK